MKDSFVLLLFIMMIITILRRMYNSTSYKTKQFLWLLVKLFTVIGCSYFIYVKLAENEQLRFSDFWLKLTQTHIFSFKNSIILLTFSFFNWFFEILKWKTLISFIEKSSLSDAVQQSLASLTVSLITPNRIGEYGAKALYYKKEKRKQVLGLNLVGNFYQMLMTVVFGSIGFAYVVFRHNILIDFYRVFEIFLFVLILVIAAFLLVKQFSYKGYSIERLKAFIAKIPRKLNVETGIYSLLRYAVFSHQFYFLLQIFGIEISYIDGITAIFSVYLIASVIPMLSLFDIVLKGSVAIWVFSYFMIDPLTVLSITTSMWILNFVIPAIFGSYFVLTFTPKFSK